MITTITDLDATLRDPAVTSSTLSVAVNGKALASLHFAKPGSSIEVICEHGNGDTLALALGEAIEKMREARSKLVPSETPECKPPSDLMDLLA